MRVCTAPPRRHGSKGRSVARRISSRSRRCTRETFALGGETLPSGGRVGNGRLRCAVRKPLRPSKARLRMSRQLSRRALRRVCRVLRRPEISCSCHSPVQPNACLWRSCVRPSRSRYGRLHPLDSRYSSVFWAPSERVHLSPRGRRRVRRRSARGLQGTRYAPGRLFHSSTCLGVLLVEWCPCLRVGSLGRRPICDLSCLCRADSCERQSTCRRGGPRGGRVQPSEIVKGNPVFSSDHQFRTTIGKSRE